MNKFDGYLMSERLAVLRNWLVTLPLEHSNITRIIEIEFEFDAVMAKTWTAIALNNAAMFRQAQDQYAGLCRQLKLEVVRDGR